MSYDSTGATVGAAGHDAATLVAAAITAGKVEWQDVGQEFTELRNFILADSLEVQGVTALEQGMQARPAPARPRSTAEAAVSDPATLVVNQGKYKGQTIAQIDAIEDDGKGGTGREYLEWMAENLNNEFLKKRVVAYLAAA